MLLQTSDPGVPDAESSRVEPDDMTIAAAPPSPIAPTQAEQRPAAIDEVSYNIPVPLEEDSLEEPAVEDDLSDSVVGSGFQLVSDSSQRGKNKLADIFGYTYVVRRENKSGVIVWRCAKRSKSVKCGAQVLQHGPDIFVRKGQAHCHSGQPGAHTVLTVMRDVKDKAQGSVFTSSNKIVADVLQREVAEDEAVPFMPSLPSLQRTANRVREATRPDNPRDKEFLLDEEFIPEGFLIKDITTRKGGRHLVFGNQSQLAVLAKAKRWYVDGTFKVVRVPFYQLVTIHCFVKKDDCVKQLPMAYAIMSGKTKRDYRQVFQAIKDALPEAIQVQEVMLDFEKAIWTAIKTVFPQVKPVGCSFHWKNAVWRKVQNVGLTQAYLRHRTSYQLIQEVLALPYLPHEKIPLMFEQLRQRGLSAKLQELFGYINRTWIDGSHWEPLDWCNFMQSVRTNNDVEGWHHRLNQEVGGKPNLPFYQLIVELHNEATKVNLQMCLVSEQKLTKFQRRRTKQLQGRLFQYWDEFNQKTRTTGSLLRACAASYGVAPILPTPRADPSTPS